MADEPTMASATGHRLRATQVYGMAAVCLATGLMIGYLLEGAWGGASPAQTAGQAAITSASIPAANNSQGPTSPAMTQNSIHQLQASPSTGASSAAHAAMAGGHMPTMGEMRQMADKQAAPLLEKLKTDPSNGALLAQVGAIYHTTHQFKEAADYYGKAVKANPKDVAIRTKLAISLYRSGKVDDAIAQLNLALKQDPKDATALFNLGMMRLQGKQDGKGAVAAWQQLLKTNPQLSVDRRAMVQKLMADVLTTLADEHEIQGAGSHDEHKSNSN